MNIETNKIYTFKMNSGEEVIAKVLEFDHPWILVNEPVAIAPGPQGMGLIPALFTADHSHSIEININSCAFVALTDESVTTKYIQATTGLSVPEKKIVLG